MRPTHFSIAVSLTLMHSVEVGVNKVILLSVFSMSDLMGSAELES